ncbi:MAG: DUF4376 domain-containing protein [Rhizobiales bacterium]|nr:DUF4376 domain-containing protein [Hyphomicrobiales bacterium]
MGGTTYAGMPIATDRESRAIMSQSVLYLREKPVDETIDWKGPGGWVNLDLASLTAATLAAGDHVDATFRREKAIAAAIASGAVNSIAQIDEAFADVTRAWAI